MEKIDFWSVEGSIYPKLDANYMRGEKVWDENFNLGANQKLSLYIKSKDGSPINPQQNFNTSGVSFSLNFREEENWFRVDNQGNHGFLHFHLESGTNTFDKDRVSIPEDTTVSGIISFSFEKAEEIIKWKFPNIKVDKGKDFLGTA